MRPTGPRAVIATTRTAFSRPVIREAIGGLSRRTDAFASKSPLPLRPETSIHVR